MGVEWVAGMLVVVAIACMAGAVWLLFREKWFMPWLRGSAGFLLLAGAVYLALLSASLFSYQAVPGKSAMAVVSFQADGVQKWRVTLAEANGNRRIYSLQGDLWQLDVRLLRYTGVAAMFGAGPSFELERLSSRYLSVEDQSAKDHSDYQLVTAPFMGFDLWARAMADGSLIVRPSRSNIALVPAADGAIFEVHLGENGLTLMPANSAAEDALKRIGG